MTPSREKRKIPRAKPTPRKKRKDRTRKRITQRVDFFITYASPVWTPSSPCAGGRKSGKEGGVMGLRQAREGQGGPLRVFPS
jgi:hypothetical protein